MLQSRLRSLLFLSAILVVDALPGPTVPWSITEISHIAKEGKRLISHEDGAEPVWKTEDQVLELVKAGSHFFDVTDTHDSFKNFQTSAGLAMSGNSSTIYPTPSHQAQVQPILSAMTTTRMESWLETLTGFHTRFYNSTTGVAASEWILETAQGIAAPYQRTDVEVVKFEHSWTQSSVIARIRGSDPSVPLVLLGSHIDSENHADPTGRAPGADDDGSGTVNLLEAFQTLLEADFRPRATVEFQWYAAEAVGHRGSQAIASSYKDSGLAVAGHFQLDMTGYFKPGTEEVIALSPDYVDEALTDFTKNVITEYAKIPWVMNIPCGYACSDHGSFYRLGYPTTYPTEAMIENQNPHVHSDADTTSVEGFSWSHSLEFAKVATAWAYELAM